jgi:putative nucleotidyltransferase with HDIG domain
MDRATAWEIVKEHVKDAGLRRHMLSVEAAMRDYAPKLDGDPDLWGVVGLLHDFDWEIHPTLEDHPQKGAEILRSRGVGDEILQPILSHNTAGTGVQRTKPIDFALLACDEITGLMIAAALVRPSRDIRDMQIKSVIKKWKDKSFAAGVERPHVEQAVEDFSRECFDGTLDLWQHCENVLESMKGIAAELELDGRAVHG